MASLGNGMWQCLPGPLGRETRFGGAVRPAPAAQRRAPTDAGFTVDRVEAIFPMICLYVARKPAISPIGDLRGGHAQV